MMLYLLLVMCASGHPDTSTKMLNDQSCFGTSENFQTVKRIEVVCTSTVTCRTTQFCLFQKLNSLVGENHGTVRH